MNGRYREDGDRVLIESEIVDAAHRKTVRKLEPVNVSRYALLDGVALLRRRVMEVLAPAGVSGHPPTTEPEEKPPSWRSYRSFVSGMEKYAQRDRFNIALQLLLARQYGVAGQAASAEKVYQAQADHSPTAEIYRGLQFG